MSCKPRWIAVSLVLFLLAFCTSCSAPEHQLTNEHSIGQVNGPGPAWGLSTDHLPVDAPEMQRAERVQDRVHFDVGSAKINSFSVAELDSAIAWIKRFPRVLIDIDGHSDDRGGRAANERLALQRAQALRAVLLDHGVPASQIGDVRSRGSDHPFASGHSENARAKNRVAVMSVHQSFPPLPLCELRTATSTTMYIANLPPDVFVDLIGRLSAHTPPGEVAISNYLVLPKVRDRAFYRAETAGDRLVVWYEHREAATRHFHAVAYRLTDQGPRWITNVVSDNYCITDELLDGSAKGLKQASEW